MSDRKLPRARGAHSIAGAELGARLNLKRRRGAENAKLLWFVILSHTPWSTLTRPTWACDQTLANEAGLDIREQKRALAVLREAELLTTPTGHRPGARRPWGRLLVPKLGAPVKVLIPDVGLMTNLWITCRDRRKRPGALVTLAVGCYVRLWPALAQRLRRGRARAGHGRRGPFRSGRFHDRPTPGGLTTVM